MNILGADVPMNGRIPRAGGRHVQAGTRLGVVYDQAPEDAAFQRWQAEQFDDVERMFAQRWRAALKETDLKKVAAAFQNLGIDGHTCRSLEDAKLIAQNVVEGADKRIERLRLAVLFFNIPQHQHAQIIETWNCRGRPSLSEYAPYAAYVLSVEIFFYLALAANLISAERTSNRTDIGYLFYLPFCMVFVSNDRLHQRTAPYFLRPNQEFVWGLDLKSDLKKLNEHYLTLPAAERERGIMRFADRPPTAEDFLVAKLWERHLGRGALQGKNPAEVMSPEEEKKLIEELQAFTEAPEVPPAGMIMDDADIESVSIERMVKKRKGSWWQIPSDLSDQGGI